uniref:Menage a trois-like protein 1 cyclin H assembly factor isoform 2 n=1 Tax=Homo sapiens TaxID=9606 RepID=A0A0S2Z414_HUMAN|nr:menage a trois-like protein 1 cyclin H assembly factor isoform 2 [Homo sapiens]
MDDQGCPRCKTTKYRNPSLKLMVNVCGHTLALQLSREQGITLRGSAEIVDEFFSFGINSILYQRGIYPSEIFTRVQKYGLTLLVTTDLELIKYLNNVVEQLKDWLYKCSVQKLVVVISNIESGEVLER